MIKALFFDVFGTLVDWRSSIKNCGENLNVVKKEDFSWELFAIKWRLKYSPILQAVNDKKLKWNILDELHKQTLDELIKDMKIKFLKESHCKILINCWHNLEGWADSSSSLSTLKNKFTTATLSNANISLQKKLLKNANFEFDFIFSAEHFKKYKPAKEVYLGAATYLNFKPKNCALVASHKNDLYAASKLGFYTIFIKRNNEYGNYKDLFKERKFKADITVESLNKLEHQLVNFN